jgi:hypothetical protein
MTEKFEWFGGRGFESATMLPTKLHAKGSGPPKIKPVSPDERLAHVEPPLKIARRPDFWA